MTLSDIPPPTSSPTEWSEVERPLMQQLQGMGWTILTSANEQDKIDYPLATGRDHFREVVQYEELKNAIRRINADDGPLDDLTIERAIRALEVSGSLGLVERNKAITERLISGVSVNTNNEGNQRQRLVRFIEFDSDLINNNNFTACNQYRVDLPGIGSFVIPDVVLLVNGIPLVVIECKSPAISDPIQEGLDQLFRYSNNRYWVDEDEGVEDLFAFNQLMVVTDFYEARVGTVGALHEHYLQWKDVSPLSIQDVAEELEKETVRLKSQELLTAGMLRPERLLDILRNYVLFRVDDGKLIKLAPRYQQYRAVNKAVERLMTGETRLASDLDQDKRGGIVWHTQGSGKSITLAYLVRKLRTVEELKPFKVVVVTDRTDLEKQLRETAALTGENVRPDERDNHGNGSASDLLKSILSEEGPDVVFAMIQKYLDRTGEAEVLEYEVPLRTPEHLQVADTDIPARTQTLRQTIRTQEFGLLNKSEKILILVDECHRSHTQTFHSNMMQALPNAAKIGFTGTPILNRDKAATEAIFGEFIDKYTLKQAVEDEATVRIVYEGRTADGLVDHTDQLDRAFLDMFRSYTEEEQKVIRNRYATTGDVLEAPRLIAEKATDMMYHYVQKIMPGGFKAQVVSVSRQAAMTYRDSLADARDALVAEIEGLDRSKLDLAPDELENEDSWTQFLVGAYPDLETIKRIYFAAIISHNHNDPPSWRQWSDKTRQQDHISRFKKPLVHTDPEKQDGLAFLCVQNMLLTGFDAPVEQVLYLDRKLIAHDLLQAIARVNRRANGKDCGYVVDYIGIARHLQEALGGYEDDTSEPMTDIRDEIPKLRDRHKLAVDVFLNRGIASIRDVEACVDLLADVKIRAEFINKLRNFLASLAIVMPRPEALPYQRDAKILGFIAKVASNIYHDGQLDLHGVHHKVKQLIDQYVSANGIDPKIPPVEILDVNFAEAVAAHGSASTRASKMKHAARHHIKIRFNEDPDLYATLSEKLEHILEELKDRWAELEQELKRFIEEELLKGRDDEIEGLDPKVQAPFFGVIKRHLVTEDSPDLDDETLRTVVETTVEIVEQIQRQIGRVGFWRDQVGREQLERRIYRILRRSGRVPQEKLTEIAVQMVDLAKSRHRFLVT